MAESLECILAARTEFRLRRTPADERWQYVEDLLEIFGENQDLAVASFIDAPSTRSWLAWRSGRHLRSTDRSDGEAPIRPESRGTSD